MRRRDVLFLCVIWGAALGGLAWALSTQLKWVQESKPPRPAVKPEAAETAPPPETGTGVIGTVNEDTVAAMAKGLHAPSAGRPSSKDPSGAKKPAPR